MSERKPWIKAVPPVKDESRLVLVPRGGVNSMRRVAEGKVVKSLRRLLEGIND